MAEKFIQKAIKHPGALRKSLHMKKGKKIPMEMLKKAEHSKNPKMAKRAHLAETLKHMHHEKSPSHHKKYSKSELHAAHKHMREHGG